MGMSQTVNCPGGVPEWPRIASWLAANGSAVQLRMIDGQLAFPDEEPPADWREIRVALGGTMVTIRRQEAGVELVTWGNADEASRRVWEMVAKAFSETG